MTPPEKKKKVYLRALDETKQSGWLWFDMDLVCETVWKGGGDGELMVTYRTMCLRFSFAQTLVVFVD